MNDPSPPDAFPPGHDTATAPDPAKGASRPRLTPVHLVLVLLVAALVWQWLDARYRLDQMQQSVTQRMSEMDGANKANQALVDRNQELVRELGGKLSLLESRVAETGAQRATLDALHREMAGTRERALLADVEQSLLVAEQQLQISGNTKAALATLQSAAGRLQRSESPGAADLRRRIERDIAHLRVLPDIDMRAIDRQLDQLIAVVERLPLAQAVRLTKAAERTDAAGDGAWRRFWHEVWQEVRQLVRVERTDQAGMPLLSPSQSFFVRENTKLVLLSARLSLLSRDEAGFRRELNTVQGWVGHYFDTTAHETVLARQLLRKLLTAHVAVELPDISATLTAARNFRMAQDWGAQ